MAPPFEIRARARAGDVVGREAELLEHDLARRAGPEVVDAQRVVGVAVPAEGGRRPRPTASGSRRRQHRVAVVVALEGEQLPAGQRHDPGGHAAGGQRGGGVDADPDLAAGGHQHDLGRAPSGSCRT